MKRFALVTLLVISTGLVMACGDNGPKLSSADKNCLALLQAGQPCAPSTATTATVTAVQTVTVTNTTIVNH